MIEQIASRVRIQQYQNYLKDKTKSPLFLGDQNVIPLGEQSDLFAAAARFSPFLDFDAAANSLLWQSKFNSSL